MNVRWLSFTINFQLLPVKQLLNVPPLILALMVMVGGGVGVGEGLNPLHFNISMHILHTTLYIFPNVLARRICLTIERFFS